MRATLLHNYRRARSRVNMSEEHAKRVRTFIVYVLFVLLLLTIFFQATGFSLKPLLLKMGAEQDQDQDKDIALKKNTSQAVYPLPDNVSCRYDWLDRQTMQIRKSIVAPCNKDNKPSAASSAPTSSIPAASPAPPRSGFSWGK
jgi:hypothetical protein